MFSAHAGRLLDSNLYTNLSNVTYTYLPIYKIFLIGLARGFVAS